MSPNADKHYIRSFLDECLEIDNELATTIVIFTIAAGLFILTMGTYIDNEVSGKIQGSYNRAS